MALIKNFNIIRHKYWLMHRRGLYPDNANIIT